MNSMHYFLGANTADGFVSLYDGFADIPAGDFLWILKGGAGCGKSSYMKMIGAAAQRSNLQTEYAHCSGDPDSLDGVYIPELSVAIMDGTAPHTADALLAGADSAYLDLGRHYNIAAISEYTEMLRVLKKGNSDCYDKAYSMLKAAGEVVRGGVYPLNDPLETSVSKKRITNILKRELRKVRADGGRTVFRFLSAYTCKGLIAFPETVNTLCRKIYCLDGSITTTALALESVAAYCQSMGYQVMISPDPLTPEIPEAVIIPNAGLGFIRNKLLIPDGAVVKHINTESRSDPEVIHIRHVETKRMMKLSNALISEAICSLEEAKRIHDEIEEIYNPNVDFDGVYADVAAQLAYLGLK